MDKKVTSKPKKTAAKNTTPKKGVARFQKGHTPWNKGKKMAKQGEKKPNSDKKPSTIAGQTVRIFVVKDKVQEAQKDFKYDDAAFKERTCTRFLNSIVANKPRKVEIEDQVYYSAPFVKGLIRVSNASLAAKDEEYKKLSEKYEAIKEEYDKTLEAGNELCDVAADLGRDALKMHRSNRLWKGVSIGLTVTLVATMLLRLLDAKPTPPREETLPAAIEIVQ